MRWLLPLFACLLFISTHAASGEPWRVGVLYWSDTIPCQQVMRQGLEQAAERINRTARASGQPELQLLTQFAGDGPAAVEQQIWQMRTLVDEQRPDIIIVQPSDNAALIEPLQRANLAGIPVVAYDQYISGGVLASYVTSDNHQAGYMAGEYMAAQLAERQQPLRLVLVEYPMVSSTVERVDGFLTGLKEAGAKFKILKSYLAILPEEGHQAAHKMLHDFPEKGSVDLLFTVNNGAGMSMVDVLEAAGRTEILHASIDGDPESIDNVRQQRLTRIDSAQFCAHMGATALQHAHQILQGKAVARHVTIPAFPVTRETLDQFPGWAGHVPASFDKPWPSRIQRWRNQVLELD